MGFYFIYRYTHVRTLLSLSRRLQRIKAAQSTWTWGTLLTVYYSTSRRIYIPHLLAHAFLTLDSGSPAILTRWDNATISNQRIINQTLEEYTFGMHRSKWREVFFRTEVYQRYGSGCFLLQQATKEVRKSYRNTGDIAKHSVSVFCCHYSSKKRFTGGLKVIESPLYSHLNSVTHKRGLLVEGPLGK